MPNILAPQKQAIRTEYSLCINNVTENGSCAPESIAKCRDNSVDFIMTEISQVLQRNPEICKMMWTSIVSDNRVPESMKLLVQKFTEERMQAEIAVPIMVSKVHKIQDTECYYWWDQFCFELFCEGRESIVLLQAEGTKIRLRQLFNGDNDTFIILVHHIDHFMPCSLWYGDQQQFVFDKHDRDGFVLKYPKIAELIDPHNRRWFREMRHKRRKYDTATATVTTTATATTTATTTATEKTAVITDYIATEETGFLEGDLVAISNRCVKDLSMTDIETLHEHMVAVALIEKRNICAQFMKCKIVAHDELSLTSFIQSERCVNHEYVEGIMICEIDTFFLHSVSTMGIWYASKGKDDVKLSPKRLTKDQLRLTEYADNFNKILREKSNWIHEGRVGNVVQEGGFVKVQDTNKYIRVPVVFNWQAKE